MAIYFMRHGESEANVAGVFAGQELDSPLTENGVRQARRSAVTAKGKGITKIISSDLLRTRRTALEASEVLHVKTVHIDNRIIEYGIGSLAGKPQGDMKSLDLIVADGTEDIQAFQDRITAFLRDYKDSPENILIVSHGGVARLITALNDGTDPKLFLDLPEYPNARVTQLNLDWL